MKRKLDFGSGHSPAHEYLTCDVTGSPILDYMYVDGKVVPAEDGEFDVIRCRNVLHHVPDLDELFTEFWRVLSPEGCIITEEPSPEAFGANVFLDRLWYRVIIPRPKIWFAKVYRDYSAVALDVGFQVCSCDLGKVVEKLIFRKNGKEVSDGRDHATA